MSIAYPTLLHEFRSEIKTNKIQNQWHFIFFVHSFLIALLFALCASPRRFMFKATCKALEEKIHKKSIFYKVSTRSVRKQKFMRQTESWFHGGGVWVAVAEVSEMVLPKWHTKYGLVH
jgi:hypothetical protein